MATDKIRSSLAAALPQAPVGRIGAWYRRWQPLLRVLLGVVALGLGFWGLALKAPPTSWSGAFNTAFQTLQMLTFQFPRDIDGTLPWQLNVARFLLPALALFETYRLLIGSIRRPVKLALVGLWRDHVVITIGGAATGFQLLRHLRAQRRRVVVVGARFGEEETALIEASGAAVVTGDPRTDRAWHGACADRAAAVIVAHGGDSENLNAAVTMALTMRGRVKRRGQQPVMIVLIENDSLAAQVEMALDGASRDSGMRYRRLSGTEEAARALFLEPPPALAKPDRAVPAHILLLGCGAGAQAVIRAALALAQDAPGAGPCITVLDEKKAIAKLPLLADGAVPGFIADIRTGTCEWEDGLPAEGALAAALEGRPPVSLACVCRDDDDDDAMLTGLALARLAEAAGWPALDIWVNRPEEDRFLSTLSESDVPFANVARLRPFGGVLPATTIGRILDGIEDLVPRALHQHYLAGLERQGAGTSGTRLDWEELPENLRHASRASAEHIAVKLAVAGCRVAAGPGSSALAEAEIEVMAEIEHRRWCAERVLGGWRHGAARDDAARLHPDLIPYADLDEPAREKDRDMVRALPAVLALAGLRIARDPGSPQPING